MTAVLRLILTIKGRWGWISNDGHDLVVGHARLEARGS